jgi:hypothetical protein
MKTTKETIELLESVKTEIARLIISPRTSNLEGVAGALGIINKRIESLKKNEEESCEVAKVMKKTVEYLSDMHSEAIDCLTCRYFRTFPEELEKTFKSGIALGKLLEKKPTSTKPSITCDDNGYWTINGFDKEMASAIIRSLSDVFFQKETPKKLPSLPGERIEELFREKDFHKLSYNPRLEIECIKWYLNELRNEGRI